MKLDDCFGHAPNPRARKPKATEITAWKSGSSFQSLAFNVLLTNKPQLGIRSLFQCDSARVDGYLITLSGETILLEIKECLGWGAIAQAGFQFLTGRELLKRKAKRGLIVFQRISAEWEMIEPHGGWGQLALHSQELAGLIELGGLQIDDKGKLTHAIPDSFRLRQAGGES